jgi:hypothetical protein
VTDYRLCCYQSKGVDRRTSKRRERALQVKDQASQSLKAVRESKPHDHASLTRPRGVLSKVVILITSKDVEISTGIKLSALLGQGRCHSDQRK